MAITPGTNLNTVEMPQVASADNYLDFTSGTNDWSQQYLPDLMEKEAEVFGKRTIAGFLEKVGAEEAMQSDQVVWSEQGRLHLSYKATLDSSAETMEISHDVDGNAVTTTHGIRVNDMLLITSSSATARGVCTLAPANDATVTIELYDGADIQTTFGANAVVQVLVYGSEYGKGQSYSTSTSAVGTVSSRTSNEPQFKSFSNKPIIMKDFYSINGSDTSQVGWVEISQENGPSGYYWYLKAEGETRMRFADYMEMAMLESVKATNLGSMTLDTLINGAGESFGTQGLFDAVSKRGNTTSGVTGVNAATDLAEFDAILAEFDKQGAIEEYMMFIDRSTSLAIDDMLASMNSYGAGGTSYGVFENDENMALNLGFSGFRRGSYDFYKSDFRYLNDKATRGGLTDTVNNIRGIMIPAGTSTVYDQSLGKNLKRPFLHVRYRASKTDNRKFKTWTTGSVGAATSSLDAMEIHMLSERCLITQGANNFMLMQ
jgi:uncharacterized protein YbjQ (UPF0145 family)